MSEIQKPPNVVDLWQIAQELETKAKESKIQERTVIFVGEPNSGKSSIISLLKGTLKEEPPKPTSSFEYSYARRNTENRREILNFYELPGGKFSKELTSVPLTLNTIHNAIFVITLDLSNPATVLDSLIFWVENIKEHFDRALSETYANKPAEINKFKQEKMNEFDNFPEKAKMAPLMTNIIVLGTKYDLFETQEIESRKWMSRILRFYCHTNSLSLYYVSVVNPKLSAQIKTLLTGYLFSDISPNVLQKDHMKPIFVSKGLDNIDSIGVTMVGNFSVVDLLKKISKEYFPPKQSDTQKAYANIDFSKYGEPLIDNTKALKDKVLQKLLKKNKIESSNGNLSKYENNKGFNEGEENENEQPFENSNEKQENLYENTSNIKSTNIGKNTMATNNLPGSFVKKYRPSLNKGA